mmetsp:Transcript_27830/g.38466  ORF Transcript_27830/g.38466 Transcript_27830/m.38466 type:complete len:151 (-) Transcript_27830:274-726(-)
MTDGFQEAWAPAIPSPMPTNAFKPNETAGVKNEIFRIASELDEARKERAEMINMMKSMCGTLIKKQDAKSQRDQKPQRSKRPQSARTYKSAYPRDMLYSPMTQSKESVNSQYSSSFSMGHRSHIHDNRKNWSHLDQYKRMVANSVDSGSS